MADESGWKRAGGTPGGAVHFFTGLAMMAAGAYMLLQSITVSNGFSLGHPIYSSSFFGMQASVPGGAMLFPFCAGIVLIFRRGKSLLGWALAIGSIAAIVAGVIASLHFGMRPMSLFELASILCLGFGGLGVFLRSLAPFDQPRS